MGRCGSFGRREERQNGQRQDGKEKKPDRGSFHFLPTAFLFPYAMGRLSPFLHGFRFGTELPVETHCGPAAVMVGDDSFQLYVLIVLSQGIQQIVEFIAR